MPVSGGFPTDPISPDRRRFLEAGIRGAAVAPMMGMLAAACSDVPIQVEPRELDELGIVDLRAAIDSGKLTARSIVEKYLARIAEIDRRGPALRSVIEENPDALAIADAADKARTAKAERGPLAGIPVLIKDNIDTADAMATTAGSLALVGAKPSKDAFLVRKLRQAGAVILGKTNLSEWANIRSARSTSGWSGRGGLTCNPYALDRNPSGSSSGSAVAVAATLCAVAVGTETDGSIISPSSSNGIVGLKPTVGLVSRSGVIPISHTQDTAGPMARSVRDAAILLGVLAGIDPDDPATSDSRGKSFSDYTQFLDPKGLQGARIGVVRKFFGFHDGVDGLMDAALDAMKKAGAILVDPANIETLGKFDDAEFTVLLYELQADLNAYLAGLGPNAPIRTLKELIDFNEKNAKKEMPFFGQDTFIKAQAKGSLTSKEYVDALDTCRTLSRQEGIDATMDKFKLDALVAPSGGPAWLTDLVDGDHYTGGSSNAAAVAGYPSITVPAGLVFGLPVGISFFGRAWSEATVLRLAYAFEQATHLRESPRFLPTVDVTR